MYNLLDFDALQQEFVESRLEIMTFDGKNEEEKLAQMYEVSLELQAEFANTPLLALGDSTPQEYFNAMDNEELVEQYLAYYNQTQSVPEVLYNVLTEKPLEETLCEIVQDEDRPMDLRMLTMGLLDDMQSTALAKYYAVIQSRRAEKDDFADKAMDSLRNMDEAVVEPILLSVFEESGNEGRDAMLEILAKPFCSTQVFDHALRSFIKAPKHKEIYAYYLGKMENEEALPFLIEAVESEELDYIDYLETRATIERLGGTCKEIDYTEDPLYKKIHA